MSPVLSDFAGVGQHKHLDAPLVHAGIPERLRNSDCSIRDEDPNPGIEVSRDSRQHIQRSHYKPGKSETE
ncbi:hypothetical protein BgiMline_003343 [Biomphalaria glabrata]